MYGSETPLMSVRSGQRRSRLLAADLAEPKVLRHDGIEGERHSVERDDAYKTAQERKEQGLRQLRQSDLIDRVEDEWTPALVASVAGYNGEVPSQHTAHLAMGRGA
jgi:hypothetical protein